MLMSHALSLKLQENIFHETERLRKADDIPRNTYINQALEFFNKYNRKRMLRKQLAKECALVKDDNLRILKEFEGLDEHLIE